MSNEQNTNEVAGGGGSGLNVELGDLTEAELDEFLTFVRCDGQ